MKFLEGWGVAQATIEFTTWILDRITIAINKFYRIFLKFTIAISVDGEE